MKLINKYTKYRDYFLYIDHKGLLYLEETQPKNYTSCIKDKRFFDNFYKNLILNQTGRYMDQYPYLSKCWGEFNFVRCHSTPIVFNEILKIDNQLIIKAQNHYQEEFSPNNLFIKNQLIYHKCQLNDLKYGILATELAIQFSNHLIEHNILQWEDKLITLQELV